MHNPLDQFKIKTLHHINLFGFDVSFTNSSLFMVLSLVAIIGYMILAIRKKGLVPSRMQLSAELVYNMIEGTVIQNAGPKARRFIPLIMSLFLFILVCNLFGMLPYSFTVTSHIIVTFSLAMVIFLLITILGFYLHGTHFLSLLLPPSTPWWLAPLMIIIELFAYLAKPISLSLRLAANMMAGHILLKVMAGFVVTSAIYFKIFPIPVIVLLVGFEIFVAILQAYIFTVLSCVYLNDAINLH